MLSTAELLQNIHVYQVYFNKATDIREALLPSKAALLDVCGWIEEAMDKVVIDCAGRCSLSAERSKSVREDYVKRTYGFDYERHFEKMLTAVVGFKILEQAEAQIGPTTMTPFTSAISSLLPLRNHYAHTHLDTAKPYPKNITTIPAPTGLIPFVNQVDSALVALENALRSLNY